MNREQINKALDLSHLLRHAFRAGYTSSAGDMGWADYDPTTCQAYERILSAIDTSPVPALTDEAVERMADWLRANFMMSSFHKGTSREHIKTQACAALLAAFPSKGGGE